MILFDIVNRTVRVAKALFIKSPAQVDVRFESMHTPARYRGEHRIDHETCIGCDSCNKICPTHAITMKKLPFKKQNIVPEVNLSVCIFCGLCEDVCPTKPEKSIILSGGRYDMISGGWHEDQNDFWVNVDIPQSYIDSRLEEEEAARVKKELIAKKKAAEKEAAKKAKEAEEAGVSVEDKPTAFNGAPDFNAPIIEEEGETK
jgi:NADH-quinone oxidoreductase subunit I